MSYQSNPRNQSAPEFWHEEKEHARKLAQAVNGILNGKTNNAFTVTLDAGSTTTSVDFSPARDGGSAMFFAQNGSAAELIRTTNVYASTSSGQVTVTHGAAVGGEIFSLVVVG